MLKKKSAPLKCIKYKPHCVTVALDLWNPQVAWWNGDTRSQLHRCHPVSQSKSSLLMPRHQTWGFWQRPPNNPPTLPSFHHSLHLSTHPTVAKADTHPGLLSAVLAPMTDVCWGQSEILRQKWRERKCGGENGVGQLSAVLVLAGQVRTP